MPQGHYSAALKAGKKELQACASSGRPTELPVLDTILEHVDIRGEVPLGLMDIPSELLVGTKTRGRTASFAPNFMPILGEMSEFSIKWKNLCDAHLREGIRDPIIAYEYMNKYYVLEGNKRVSVLKYFGAPTIPGYVTRIIPAWKDTKEIRIYYEFLDFYNATNINYLSFSEEGSYRKLCHILGHKKHDRWTLDERIDFRSCYILFSNAFADLGGNRLSCTAGDALLIYLELFPYEELKQQTPEDIETNLGKIWEEIELHQNTALPEEKIAMKLDPTPEQKKNILTQIFIPTAATDATKIAFIHNKTAETSSWTYAHELGRMYLKDAFHGEIETSVYDNNADSQQALAAIERAIADGNTVIFTTTPEFLSASRKAAINHPEVKILNCSLNSSHKYIRTYYGRMFEAKLLTGILAGIMTDTDKIGYIADYPIAGMTANINAFAIGVKMVNPRAKVYLEWSTLKENEGVDLTEKLFNMNATYISNQDMIVPLHTTRRFGLYRVNGETPVNLAFPVWDWGKYYELIIRNVQHGTWDTERKSDSGKATSYWWGMSAGVIDVVWSQAIPSETRNLLESLKRSIIHYDLQPFTGILHSQDGIVQSDPNKRMTFKEIICMDWLTDNVIGFIPTVKDLREQAQSVVRQEGIRREDETE